LSAAPQGDAVLSAQGLVMRFGGITATSNVNLGLRRGARHALIGPNGAGKTTLVNLLTGVLQPTSSSIRSRRCRRWRWRCRNKQAWARSGGSRWDATAPWPNAANSCWNSSTSPR
jgi:ABC-type branched-subunit amino acid transport system ATPase component